MIKDAFIWTYWYPFRLFIQKIPVRYTYLLAKIFGKFVFYISVQKRRSLERELECIFNSTKKKKDFKKVIQNAFVILFQNEIEVLQFPKVNARNIESFVKCSGLEHLDNALYAGKGVMLLFAHFGANQMIMPAIGYRGYQMSQLSAPPMAWKERLPNKKFTHMVEKGLEIRWKHEESLPVNHINIFGSLKGAFLCLKRNEILGVAMDGGGGKNKVEVNFLGRKALFSTGSIEIAMRTGCSVLPTFMVRKKNGKNTMIIEPSLKLETGNDAQETAQMNIQVFVGRLQDFVLQHPSHYLNFLALRRFMAEQGDDPFFIEGEQT